MKSSVKRRNTVKAVPFLLPALISILILVILPILYTVVIAFTDTNKFNSGNVKFVGFTNFIDVINGPFSKVFLPVLLWTVTFAVLATIGTFFLGLVVAMVLHNPNLKERGLYKAILILPWALPATIAIISWQGLLNGTNGAINNMLLNIHLISQPIPWITSPNWARAAVIMVTIWLSFPYMMNVCLGSLGAIPESYYEAARVDGASKWVQFKSITLPSLAKTAYPLIISSFSFNFNNFGAAYLITEGNPPRITTQFAGYTDILASVNYKLSTVFGRYDVGATIAIIIFIILAVISYSQMKLSGQFEEVE